MLILSNKLFYMIEVQELFLSIAIPNQYYDDSVIFIKLVILTQFQCASTFQSH